MNVVSKDGVLVHVVQVQGIRMFLCCPFRTKGMRRWWNDGRRRQREQERRSAAAFHGKWFDGFWMIGLMDGWTSFLFAGV